MQPKVDLTARQRSTAEQKRDRCDSCTATDSAIALRVDTWMPTTLKVIGQHAWPPDVGKLRCWSMTSNQTGRSGSPEREHFGWRATSAVPAKKRKYIEGVSGRGVVELQAQLYRTQEHAKLRSEGLDITDKHVRKRAGIDVASIRNPGVEAREARDKQLQLKARGEGQERLAESTAALQRKSQLYGRLAKGEIDDDDERYEVEFWRKGASHQQEEQEWLPSERPEGPVDTFEAAIAGSGAMTTADMDRERERRDWEQREAAVLQQEEEEQSRRTARLAAVKELSGLTQAGREQAAAAKAQKEEQLAVKRAKMKAAFVSQQMKSMLESKKKKAVQ